MTNEEMRIAIAEACGWTEIQWSELINPRIAIENKQFCCDTEQFRCLWLPDYLNDLNAMHEAELVFIGEGKSPNYFAYRQQLYQVCCLSPDLAIRATAAQRAEAFLRTKGLLS